MNLSDTAVLIKALASTGSPITITDAQAEDNPIVYCNDAFLTLSGYSRKEIIGKNCRFMQGEGTDRREVSKLRQAIDDTKDTSVVLLNYTKDGVPFWNDLRISPVFNDDHVLTHFIGFQNDISARLEKERVDLLIEKMERDIALSTLEDERLEKLNRIKDEFIAVASKQLHEPVVSVAASLKILATTMDTLSTPQKDALQRAIRENEKQQAVIEELLSVAQLDSGKVVLHKRLTDVHEAMNASEASLLEIDPQLTISKVDEPVLVRIDAGILETALCHLVSAAKAYAKGHRALVLTADANTVRIYVIAHGVSIDSVTREQLFNTFSSPKTDIAEQHTLGLGLYWVKTIAALHNGTVEISDESQPDLTFRLSLARIEADA